MKSVQGTGSFNKQAVLKVPTHLFIMFPCDARYSKCQNSIPIERR